LNIGKKEKTRASTVPSMKKVKRRGARKGEAERLGVREITVREFKNLGLGEKREEIACCGKRQGGKLLRGGEILGERKRTGKNKPEIRTNPKSIIQRCRKEGDNSGTL